MIERGELKMWSEKKKRTTVLLSRDLLKRVRASLGEKDFEWERTSISAAVGRALELAIAHGWKMPDEGKDDG